MARIWRDSVKDANYKSVRNSWNLKDAVLLKLLFSFADLFCDRFFSRSNRVALAHTNFRDYVLACLFSCKRAYSIVQASTALIFHCAENSRTKRKQQKNEALTTKEHTANNIRTKRIEQNFWLIPLINWLNSKLVKMTLTPAEVAVTSAPGAIIPMPTKTPISALQVTERESQALCHCCLMVPCWSQEWV